MQSQTPTVVNINELVDIKDISIDTSQPVIEKEKSYHRQIKNDRCFRYDDTVVRLSFMDTGPTLQDRIKQYLLSGQSMEIASA